MFALRYCYQSSNRATIPYNRRHQSAFIIRTSHTSFQDGRIPGLCLPPMDHQTETAACHTIFDRQNSFDHRRQQRFRARSGPRARIAQGFTSCHSRERCVQRGRGEKGTAVIFGESICLRDRSLALGPRILRKHRRIWKTSRAIGSPRLRAAQCGREDDVVQEIAIRT